MTKRELVKLMIENFTNEDGDLNLTGLDFSEFDGDVYISEIKVKKNLAQEHQLVGGIIWQGSQKSGSDIHQNKQQVKGNLWQDEQNVQGDLWQDEQNVGCNLYQSGQKVKGNLRQYSHEVEGYIYNANEEDY